jgi:hypothetical protein
MVLVSLAAGHGSRHLGSADGLACRRRFTTLRLVVVAPELLAPEAALALQLLDQELLSPRMRSTSAPCAKAARLPASSPLYSATLLRPAGPRADDTSAPGFPPFRHSADRVVFVVADVVTPACGASAESWAGGAELNQVAATPITRFR